MAEFKVRSALSAPDACSQFPGCMQMWRGPMARPDMCREEVRVQPPRCIRLRCARLTSLRPRF